MNGFFFPDMRLRSNDPELMDMADCDKKKLINTVKQFTILNLLFTRSRHLIKKYIINDALLHNRKKITFLDIGSGGCDIPIWFVKKCRDKNIDVNITCLDNDKRIVKYAEKKCENIKAITIINDTAANIERYGKFDYIFTNHFLHHLPLDMLQEIIKKISNSTKRLFLLNDILRSNSAYFGYTIFTGLFFHNSFSFYDGRLSIRRGFTREDLNNMLEDNPLRDSVEIKKIIPARIFILGKKI